MSSKTANISKRSWKRAVKVGWTWYFSSQFLLGYSLQNLKFCFCWIFSCLRKKRVIFSTSDRHLCPCCGVSPGHWGWHTPPSMTSSVIPFPWPQICAQEKSQEATEDTFKRRKPRPEILGKVVLKVVVLKIVKKGNHDTTMESKRSHKWSE